MAGADLHVHSTASDGYDTPARVCERAVEAGLDAIALTDHDSVDGVAEAVKHGARLGLEVLAGCELTAYEGEMELHILGYGVDIENEELLGHLHEFRLQRRLRAERIVEQLDAAGAGVALERVLELAGPRGAVGRPHVARALLEAGHVGDFDQAFDRFLARGRPAYFPKPDIAPRQVIEIIHAAGGVAVLAHPAINAQECMVERLLPHALDGIEVWHSLHRPDQSDALFALALRLGLLKTGGSDCHGALPGRQASLGNVRVNPTLYRALRDAIARRRTGGEQRRGE